jgi:hypothetical protein
LELSLFKSEEDLIREGIERLENTELTVSGSSGKIARLLLNIVNSILGDETGVYETLRINHLNAFLSTSSGSSLDGIGQLLNVNRILAEDDETYRYRISKATTDLAKANTTSIKLAALSVDGVQDILVKEFAYGTGSFALYIVTEYPLTPDSINEGVRSAVDEVKGYGVRFEVLNPLIKDVKINVSLTFKEETSDTDKTILINDTKSLIVSYINSLSMGQELNIYELKYNVINLSSYIRDFSVASMRVNDEAVFISNQKSKWNERFLISSDQSSISIQGE